VLEKPIEEANEIAQKLELAYRFVKKESEKETLLP
jgi:hypothetical protein